jgi:hypothetical protein
MCLKIDNAAEQPRERTVHVATRTAHAQLVQRRLHATATCRHQCGRGIITIGKHACNEAGLVQQSTALAPICAGQENASHAL